MRNVDEQVRYQREYYSTVASHYDHVHVMQRDGHYFALAALEGLLDFLECHSVLDIGAGTGRVVRYFKQRKPQLEVKGIEPVVPMRQRAYELGVLESEIVEGDATNIPFGDGTFDMVTETGVLHHIPNPERAIAEMLRVAGKAIFISDGNNMGQGSPAARRVKHILKACGLFSLAYYIRNGGKLYWTSDGDGLAYPFSIFNHYAMIRAQCKAVHIINTEDAHISLYHSAPQVALLGIKR
jgi:SAM-dependent methyltransferase